MGNQISMLQANFPGKSLVEVAQRLLEQRDPGKYVQTLDFKPDWVSCEYHTAYQQPSMVQKLHDLGIKAAYWTVDGEQAVKDLWPLQPDAIVTNRPDRVREWVSELEMEESHKKEGSAAQFLPFYVIKCIRGCAARTARRSG